MYPVIEKLYKYVDPSRAVSILIEGYRRRIVRLRPDKSIGYITAEPIYAEIDRPYANLSHVDGWAVRSEDTRTASSENPVKLRVKEEIDSRRAGETVLAPGETVFVETGFPIPSNADAVIPVESTRRINGYVYIYAPVPRGYNVFPKGSDFRRGEELLPKGARITGYASKLLMDAGVWRVKVYDKPRIAVYSTGVELKEEPALPGQTYIPDSSRLFINKAVEMLGGKIIDTANIPDSSESIAGVIEEVLGDADLVITIGGVSMGPRDMTWTSIKNRIKYLEVFRGTKMHPGRSTSGFRTPTTSIINLPGLPQSTIAATLLILSPVIKYMAGGEPEALKPDYMVRLAEDYRSDKYLGFHRIRYVDTREEGAAIIENNPIYNVSTPLRYAGITIIPPGKKPSKNELIPVYRPQVIYGLEP